MCIRDSNQVREELKVEEVNEIINKYRESWKQNISRMGSTTIAQGSLIGSTKREEQSGKAQEKMVQPVWSLIRLNSISPVSYTHLDVYKRQVIYYLVRDT